MIKVGVHYNNRIGENSGDIPESTKNPPLPPGKPYKI